MSLLCVGLLLTSTREACAQQSASESSPSNSDIGLIGAYGINGGFGVAPEQRGLLAEAYYDVPIASLYFSPGLRFLLLNPNSMFSVEVRVKAQLWSGSTLGFLSFGGNFMTWEDRANFGIPVDFSVAVPLAERLQLTVGANATPLFYLGPEKDAGMFGIFAGLRFPVL